MVSAAYRPPLVIVPPDALQLTATATLSPACVRPYATNCCVWSGSSVTVSGEETICTTGLFGGVGSVTRTGSSHAANAAAAMARGSFMRARRCDSLNEIGRASCRERAEDTLGAVGLEEMKNGRRCQQARDDGA